MNLNLFASVARRSLALPLMAVIIMGAVVASCSKEQNLLDAFPSDVDHVGTVKLKSVLVEAGFKFEADGATHENASLAAEAYKLVGLVSAIDRSEVCDPDGFAWVKGRDGNLYATAIVDDVDKLTEATSKDIEWTDGDGGFRQGEWGGFTALAGNGRFWLTDAKEAVKAVGELQKKASKAPLTALEGVCQKLSADGLLNMALRQGAAPKSSGKGAKGESAELESRWATLNCSVAENRIVASSVVIEGDGKQLTIEGMQPINPAVLSYIPGHFNFALALGLTPEFDWSVLTEAVSAFGGFQARAMMAAVTPYLQSINGTVMLAAGPANDQAYTDIDPGNWHFVLMAKLPQDKVNDITGMIRTSMFMTGISPRMTDDGLMIVPQYGMNLYIGSVDGYFAVSNMPFDNMRQNSLAPLFTGKEGAVTLELPSLRMLNPSAPAFGFKLTGQTGEGNTTAELALTGTTQPILQAILTALL